MKKIVEALRAAFAASRSSVMLAVKAFFVAFLAALGLEFGLNLSPATIESFLKLF